MELIILILSFLYGRCKGHTDALRDYKEQMKLYVATSNSEDNYKHLWVIGGSGWDAVRACKLPVFCADAWHYYDGIKYLILSLMLSVGWCTAKGYIPTFIPDTPWAVAFFIGYLWLGWWTAGLTFALYYHNFLIDPTGMNSPNVRWFPVPFLIRNSITFWNPLESKR